jgi:hypothetical protein
MDRQRQHQQLSRTMFNCRRMNKNARKEEKTSFFFLSASAIVSESGSAAIPKIN